MEKRSESRLGSAVWGLTSCEQSHVPHSTLNAVTSLASASIILVHIFSTAFLVRGSQNRLLALQIRVSSDPSAKSPNC